MYALATLSKLVQVSTVLLHPVQEPQEALEKRPGANYHDHDPHRHTVAEDQVC